MELYWIEIGILALSIRSSNAATTVFIAHWRGIWSGTLAGSLLRISPRFLVGRSFDLFCVLSRPGPGRNFPDYRKDPVKGNFSGRRHI